MIRQQLTNIVMLAAMAAGLVACSDNKAEVGDLQEFVKKIKQQATLEEVSITNVAKTEVMEYEAETYRSPFELDEDEVVQANRHREPLEYFPIEKLEFIGLINNDNGKWAIITTPDGKVYEVKVGSNIGNANGKVVKITDNRVDVAAGVDFDNMDLNNVKNTVSLTVKENT